MDYKAIIIGIAVLIAGIYAHGDTLTGSCTNESIQCELSLNNMRFCNESNASHDYSTYFSGEAGEWFDAIPDRFTLKALECTNLKVFSVANCYAEPGSYKADLVIQNSTATRATCTLELEQGHFVDIKVGPNSQNATQCEEKTYEIELTNKTIVENQNTERVDLEVLGLSKEWYNLEKTQILVAKGKNESVELKIKAPCDADFGKYDFTVRASLPNPDFYSQDSAEFNIKQGQDAKIDFEGVLADGAIFACTEQASDGKIKIENMGKLYDEFTLRLEGAEFAALAKTRVALDAGESEEINVKFAKTRKREGVYSAKLVAQSAKYDFKTEKELKITLQDCFNIDVQKVEGADIICAEEGSQYKFLLTNNRAKPIDARITFSGINASVTNSSVSLLPSQSREIAATLDVSNIAKQAQAKKTATNIEMVVDISGSMNERIGGSTKMSIAKAASINLVNDISGVGFGLRVFGQKEGCKPSQLLAEVKNLDISALSSKISLMEPKGLTPLVEALNAASNDFNAGGKKVIILVSDGKETCEGDTRTAGFELAAKGIIVYSIGFDIDSEGQTQLEGISSRTKGKYYDAKNYEQLSNALKSISQELDISPSISGTRKFTLNIDSPEFSYSKDFTLKIEDCYAAALLLPQLNLCSNVTKNEVFTIANLGTKQQNFTLQYSPSFISGPSSINIGAGEEKRINFSARTAQRESKNYSVSIDSGKIATRQQGTINHLSNASCFAVDLITPVSELDAASCTGVKQKLLVENRGVADQIVTLSTDKAFVTIVDKNILVKAGERSEAFYFVSPPFDLPATTNITFSASTNNGFNATAKIKLVVVENEESFEIHEGNISVGNLKFSSLSDSKYNSLVYFELANDSNSTLIIKDANLHDYNGVVQLENQTLAYNESTVARTYIDLPQDSNNSLQTVAITFTTNLGSFTRNITFRTTDFNAQTETSAENEVTIGTGLFSLSQYSTLILGLMILAVIALIGVSTYRAIHAEHKEKSSETEVSKEAVIYSGTERKAKGAKRK